MFEVGQGARQLVVTGETRAIRGNEVKESPQNQERESEWHSSVGQEESLSCESLIQAVMVVTVLYAT